MNKIGSDLFAMPWVNQIVRLFGMLGWALFVVGIIVALFDFAIESQNGRGDPKALALNIIKGFMAVNLFSVVPVKLYGLAVAMQSSMSSDLTGFVSAEGSGTLLNACLGAVSDMMFGPLLNILIIIMFGYSVIKVFFASLKRGGILLIQIAVGAMYMFSIPRGYTDGFVMWVKQVIATCLTAFFAVNHAGMRLNSVQGLLAAWFRDNACGSGDTENSGTVRTGNRSTSQY